MTQAFWGAIGISVVFGIVVTIINVRKALKNPEAYQKMTDETYAKIDAVKKDFTKNTISWEDAKKQAAAELAIEKAKKEAKKAAKAAKKNKGE